MTGRLRIIAGSWRRRQLSFPDRPGLRPTPDRVRETLFNWLGPRVIGARCLDLFAGSGALGFEAASRGAAEVVMVERDREVARALRDNVERLQATNIEVVRDDALRVLHALAGPFDIVFLDPPFGTDLLERACADLAAPGRLAPDARVYLETDRPQPPPLPSGWELLRREKAGRVRYHLAAC
ncbi:MAG: 16S rRNA (guanine(966)-N(2))-methyltransferase RsmD [Ectothiorhodospiraceae bacterium]|nr:16S rRNA (guanine(966)-N(2))-methyltransferase RsmD [Chromatiales bacterium]MCP5156484.1 16S rRNA (guanine(966)-N(2))-methyltransferase RsmD [Ectothiorhodospiraceae bacterium]